MRRITIYYYIMMAIAGISAMILCYNGAYEGAAVCFLTLLFVASSLSLVKVILQQLRDIEDRDKEISKLTTKVSEAEQRCRIAQQTIAEMRSKVTEAETAYQELFDMAHGNHK